MHDGPSSSATGGKADQAVPNRVFTPASVGGAMQFSTFGAATAFARWRWDPLIGGYCYDNSRADGGLGNAQVSICTNSPNTEINTLNLAKSWSVAIKCYFPTFSSTSTFGPVVFCHTDGVVNNFYMQALGGAAPPNKLRVAFTTGGGGTFKVADGATQLQKNRWYQFVGTYDGTTLKAYLNGALDGSLATNSTPDTTGNTGRWIVGNNGPGGSSFEIRGYVCEAMVFRRPLTAEEIKDLYENGVEIEDPPIIIIEQPPGPPPPPVSPVGLGGLIVGDNAIPIGQQRLIGPRSGHTPIF